MEIVKIVKKFGIIEIAFWIVQMNLLGVPQFTLPAGIPRVTIGMPPTGSRTNCVRVPVPNTRCTICFPCDGSQPSTQDAGLWSGANDANPAVTDWWIRIFGGDAAIELANRRHIPQPDNAITMGFDSGRNGHIQL